MRLSNDSFSQSNYRVLPRHVTYSKDKLRCDLAIFFCLQESDMPLCVPIFRSSLSLHTFLHHFYDAAIQPTVCYRLTLRVSRVARKTQIYVKLDGRKEACELETVIFLSMF